MARINPDILKTGLALFLALTLVGCSSSSSSSDGAQQSDSNFTLTIGAYIGTGTGSVTSDVIGIDCGSDCSEVYTANSMVNLSAVADGDSDFIGWSGDADCADGTVTLNADTTCYPLFNKKSKYLLTQSTTALKIWTQSTLEIPTSADTPPANEGSGVALTLARQEHEDLLLMLGESNDTASISFSGFASLGVVPTVTFSQVGFSGGYGETLTPFDSGSAVSLNPTGVTPLLISFYVPAGTNAGLHQGELLLGTGSGATITIPVGMYVYDFDLPKQQNFSTRLNVTISNLVPSGGTNMDAYTTLFEHRITPKTATWPSSFNWAITWDSSANPQQCAAFYDEYDVTPEFSIKYLAERYLNGTGWNGVGFDDVAVLTEYTGGQPRPSIFCGETLGTAAYDIAWFAYVSALKEYLLANSYLDTSYYQIMNEPQDAADYDLAADLCSRTRVATPGLKLAITEQPRPEIAEHATTPCGYDIWIAHATEYEQQYAWERVQNHSEAVWLYNLESDPSPYFNPTTVSDSGVNQRILSWAAWSQRITGWAYYNGDTLFNGAEPGLRVKLLRDSFEDYEYLFLGNGGHHPLPNVTNSMDEAVHGVATSLTSWSRNPEVILNTRVRLGFYLENTLSSLQAYSLASNHPRGSYYINFQDPAGEPSVSPLIVNAHEYMKVGWAPWDSTAGYGWYGADITNPAVALTSYDALTTSFTEAEKSQVYDDYGHLNLFDFSLESGRYLVTVAVGRTQSIRTDYHNVTVEGIPIIDERRPIDDGVNIISESQIIDLKDGVLNFEVGGRSRISGNYEFTFLDYITIEPVD